MIQTYMELALEEAQKAYELGEVPVGAVVVLNNEIISRSHNLREKKKDPTAHAEILAIQQAAKALGGWRLENCEMYVTLEPCPMCAGAIYQARLRKLYIGAKDPKAGAAGTLYNIVSDSRLNHCVFVESGILEESCSAILKRFFSELRKKK